MGQTVGTTGHELVGFGPTPSPAQIRASSLSWEGDPVISDLGSFSRAVKFRTTAVGLVVVRVRESLKEDSIWT